MVNNHTQHTKTNLFHSTSFLHSTNTRCNCPLDPRAPPNPPVRQPRFSTQVPVESRAADARAHIPLRNLGEGWPHFAVCAQCFAVVHMWVATVLRCWFVIYCCFSSDGSSTVIQSDSVVVDDAMQWSHPRPPSLYFFRAMWYYLLDILV